MQAAAALPASSASPAASAPPAAGLHCMILEDEPGISQVISRILGSYGLTSGEYRNARTALAAMANQQPKLIFLDISLDGSDAVEAIRGLAERKYTGIVQLISGHNPDVIAGIAKIGQRHGLKMRTPISKPFNAEAIRKVIQEESLAGGLLSNQPVELREALKKGWIELFYQPKIDLQKRTLVGAEGLARARHPVHGLVAPGAFLKDATPADLADLTVLTVASALRDWSAFNARGVNLKLAVNIPASILAQVPLAVIVREHRPKDENWPGLILEVTEGDVINDLDLVQEVATHLSLYKVSLSIDDFGAGFSSMKRLCELPCEEIKLDRTFVHQCADNERNARICSAVIKLGHELGLTVTAEGIERASDLNTLRAMGCDFGQGFLFSPAVERDRLIETAQKRPKISSPGDTERRSP
jgi:EAL domain-containing protein (putative c-di-GMP-specific phosphodiesterase class I)/CheY-like chemotaxis protein